jgi:site-specific DNA-methyltransferase (adenine-specific)
MFTLHNGDCLQFIDTLERGSLDAIITDPPYSSGGAYRSDRNQKTEVKYQHTAETNKTYGTFSGDNRDQRSFEKWCTLWMSACLNKTREGGVMGCFIDWRNLSSIIDAMQMGGWVYRGVTPWYKGTDQRPVKGWFRRNIEYIVWGSCGAMLTGHLSEGECLDGMFFHRINGTEKFHQTGKPIELMKDIVSVRQHLDTVFDPFMGSGTTGIACVELGKNFIGCEISPEYYSIAEKRISSAVLEQNLFTPSNKACSGRVDSSGSPELFPAEVSPSAKVTRQSTRR